MYTFSLEKVTSVEKMLISRSGAVLADGHFYQGRDKNSVEVVTFPIGKRTFVNLSQKGIIFTQVLPLRGKRPNCCCAFRLRGVHYFCDSMHYFS